MFLPGFAATPLEIPRLCQAWQSDLLGVYIAATLRLLKQDHESSALISKASFNARQPTNYDYAYDNLVYQGQLLYVLAKHFPERLGDVTAADLEYLVNGVRSNSFSTLSASYMILGLDTYTAAVTKDKTAAFTIAEVDKDHHERELAAGNGDFKNGAVSATAKAVKFTGTGKAPLFYEVTEAGFDLTPSAQSVKQALEVNREFRDEAGKTVTSVKVGEKLFVHLKIRSTNDQAVTRVAMTDLLPAGFEVEIQQPKDTSAPAAPPPAAPAPTERDGEEMEGEGADGGEEVATPAPLAPTAPPVVAAAQRIDAGGSTLQPTYADVREDRVILVGMVTPTVQEFIYKIRATNRGTFTVPPPYAESMYDRSLTGLGLSGTIRVEDNP